jgi:hypothetical protein
MLTRGAQAPGIWPWIKGFMHAWTNIITVCIRIIQDKLVHFLCIFYCFKNFHSLFVSKTILFLFLFTCPMEEWIMDLCIGIWRYITYLFPLLDKFLQLLFIWTFSYFFLTLLLEATIEHLRFGCRNWHDLLSFAMKVPLLIQYELTYCMYIFSLKDTNAYIMEYYIL